jgi:hypothetical protein
MPCPRSLITFARWLRGRFPAFFESWILPQEPIWDRIFFHAEQPFQIDGVDGSLSLVAYRPPLLPQNVEA